MASKILQSARPLKSVLSFDSELHRQYTSTYQIISTYDASPLEVVMTGGLPDYGSSYYWYGVSDYWAFLRSCESGEPSDEIEHYVGGTRYRALVWNPTVVHNSRPTDGSTNPSGGYPGRQNPLNDPPVISGSFVSKRIGVATDKDGEPIIRTNGQVYSPLPEINAADDSLRISFNTATIDLSIRSAAQGKVNSASIWGLGARQVRLDQWSYRVMRSGSFFSYIKNDLEFTITDYTTPTDVCTGPADATGFYTVLPNIGDYYINDDGDPVRFTVKGDDVQPGGGALTCAGGLPADRSAKPKLNVFAVEREYNFNNIPGLPNPLPGPFV